MSMSYVHILFIYLCVLASVYVVGVLCGGIIRGLVQGKMTDANRDVYEGEWKDDKKTGQVC